MSSLICLLLPLKQTVASRKFVVTRRQFNQRADGICGFRIMRASNYDTAIRFVISVVTHKER